MSYTVRVYLYSFRFLKVVSKVQPKNPPRIWWCANGPLSFLPLHAAGLYNPNFAGDKISDYVVSSYAPTLNTLLHQSAEINPEEFKLLTVAESSTLPFTLHEVEVINQLTTMVAVVNLTDKDATKDRVVQEMERSTWTHLACHGKQNVKSPMTSGLILHDEELELSQLIKMRLHRADFAFLSACQTAVGDEAVPEESVHLAAGMLFAGYRGLIATMWSINDEDAPKIADIVYQRILKGGKPNRKGAAHALSEAVKQLRDSGADFQSWVPFIHMGC